MKKNDITLILPYKNIFYKIILYFCSMISTLPSYDEARNAIRDRKDAKAFFNLGLLYVKGIGIKQNNVLAQYFFNKAVDMGCDEAKPYVRIAYESGEIDFAAQILCMLGNAETASSETIAALRKRIEVERKAKNYGYLSGLSNQLSVFYPEYNKEKAIDDILNNRDTIDADIFFATSTSDNTSEIYVEMQDRFLQQLYAPVEKQNVFEGETNAEYLDNTIRDLVVCLGNIANAYLSICQRFNIRELDIITPESLRTLPYIKVSDLFLLRQQGLRCLLSIKDVDPIISDKFLNNLCNDNQLLDICELVVDKDIQMFLVSFVELNIDIESIEISYLQLMREYKRNNLEPLVDHINVFVARMEGLEFGLNLPVYTKETLPPIVL